MDAEAEEGEGERVEDAEAELVAAEEAAAGGSEGGEGGVQRRDRRTGPRDDQAVENRRVEEGDSDRARGGEERGADGESPGEAVAEVG